MILKNTDNTYIIEVRNTQTIDGITDVITERASGKYYERGMKKYIMYQSEEEGVISSSTIIVDDGSVTVKRTGAAKSTIVLDVMKKTSSLYITPYGGITMHAETDKIISDLGKEGGRLRLCYTLTIQNEKYYNDMIINVNGDKR